eukprot:UN08564
MRATHCHRPSSRRSKNSYTFPASILLFHMVHDQNTQCYNKYV